MRRLRDVLEVHLETRRFERCLVLFATAIHGLNWIKHVIFLDGIFLKGRYKEYCLVLRARMEMEVFCFLLHISSLIVRLIIFLMFLLTNVVSIFKYSVMHFFSGVPCVLDLLWFLCMLIFVVGIFSIAYGCVTTVFFYFNF